MFSLPVDMAENLQLFYHSHSEHHHEAEGPLNQDEEEEEEEAPGSDCNVSEMDDQRTNLFKRELSFNVAEQAQGTPLLHLMLPSQRHGGLLNAQLLSPLLPDPLVPRDVVPSSPSPPSPSSLFHVPVTCQALKDIMSGTGRGRGGASGAARGGKERYGAMSNSLEEFEATNRAFNVPRGPGNALEYDPYLFEGEEEAVGLVKAFAQSLSVESSEGDKDFEEEDGEEGKEGKDEEEKEGKEEEEVHKRENKMRERERGLSPRCTPRTTPRQLPKRIRHCLY